MTRTVATIALLLCLCGLVAAQEPAPKIVGELKVKPHTLVRLKAEGVCVNAFVTWDVWPFDAPVDIATTSDGVFEFVAPPGKYMVQMQAYGTDEKGKPYISRARVTVVVGDVGPVPPGPKPPEPGPQPKPPVPVDPLARDLAALYEADTSGTKVPDLLLLVELYRQAAELAKSESVTTLEQLSKQVSDAGRTLLPPPRMLAVRKRIAEFVGKEFGEEDANLTSDLRIKAAAVYSRVCASLKEIGGGH